MKNIAFDNIQDPIARAEAMRAQAMAEAVTDAVEGLSGLVKGAVAKLAAYLEYRRTYAVLSGMTDRELDDIGITRGDILDVARGIDPRPQALRVPVDALAQRLAVAEAFDTDGQGEAATVRANDNRSAVAA